MRTSQDQRDQIEEDLMQSGTMPSESDIIDLVLDANAAQRSQAMLDSVQEALATEGMKLVDMTTDDDPDTVYEIVTLDDGE